MGTLKIGWLPAGILAIAVDVVAVLVYAPFDAICVRHGIV